MAKTGKIHPYSPVRRIRNSQKVRLGTIFMVERILIAKFKCTKSEHKS